MPRNTSIDLAPMLFKSLNKALYEVDKTIDILIRIIKDKNQKSKDIDVLENTYRSNIKDFMEKISDVSKEITEDNYDSTIEKDIRNIIKNANRTFRDIPNIIKIAERNNAKSISKQVAKVVPLVEKFYSDMAEGTKKTIEDMDNRMELIKTEAEKAEDILRKIEGKGKSQTPKKPEKLRATSESIEVFSEGLQWLDNISNWFYRLWNDKEYSGLFGSYNNTFLDALSAMGRGAKTALSNAFNMVTMKSGSLDKSCEDITNSIKALPKVDPTNLTSISSFFTSESFMRMSGAALGLIGTYMLIRKAFEYISKFFKGKR